MSSMAQLPRPSIALDELDQDEFGAKYFKWPRPEGTRPPVAGAVDDAARLGWDDGRRTAPPQAIRHVVPLVERFFVSEEIDLANLVLVDSDRHAALQVAAGSDAEMGAPNVDLLLGAVEDLGSWLGVTKQNLSRYLGFSPSTVMAWRRERPQRPRHPSIPTLLSLWSAVSGARDEFGAEQAVRMAWSSGRTNAGIPALPATALADWLIGETSEASLDDFLAEDGYLPGTAPLPDIDALATAEGVLHQMLSEPLAESDDVAGG